MDVHHHLHLHLPRCPPSDNNHEANNSSQLRPSILVCLRPWSAGVVHPSLSLSHGSKVGCPKVQSVSAHLAFHLSLLPLPFSSSSSSLLIFTLFTHPSSRILHCYSCSTTAQLFGPEFIINILPDQTTQRPRPSSAPAHNGLTGSRLLGTSLRHLGTQSDLPTGLSLFSSTTPPQRELRLPLISHLPSSSSPSSTSPSSLICAL